MANNLKEKKYFFNTKHTELRIPTGSIINSVGAKDSPVKCSGDSSCDTKSAKMASFFVEFLEDSNSAEESRFIDIYQEGQTGWKKTDKHIGQTNVHGQNWHFFERRPDLR